MNKRSLKPRVIDGPTYINDFPPQEMIAFGLGCEYMRIVMLAMLQVNFRDEITGENVARIKDSLNNAGIEHTVEHIQVGQNSRWVLSFSFEG